MYSFNVSAQQSVCAYCHQPIQDSILTALDATWHPEHFLCAFCNRPIAEPSFNVQDGKPYHQTCFYNAIAPRCAYCGGPLIGEFLIDEWGAQFHKEHQEQYPHCQFCGRLIPPAQQEHNGAGKPEMMRCPICRSKAIETTDEAQPVFRQCIQWISSQGLKYNNQRLSLELVDRARLARYLMTHIEPHALGATMSSTYTQNGQIVGTEISGVAVLHGLPTELFQGVVVHELGHVWLLVQGVSNLPSWAKEGFCELLAHRLHVQMNTPEHLHYARNIERNPNSVYGDGYRRIRSISDRLGFERFVQQLSATKRLPQ